MTPETLPDKEQLAPTASISAPLPGPSAVELASAVTSAPSPAERIEEEPNPAPENPIALAPTAEQILPAALAVSGESPSGEAGIAALSDAPARAADAEESPHLLLRSALQQRLLARLDRSRRLPPGLRQQLATQIETADAAADGSELPALRLSDAIGWLEQSLPAHVALVADDLGRPEHPRGESFFRDDTSGLTDDEAERIARAQVSRAGFGKK